MRILLDTHIALRAVTDDSRLRSRAKRMIADPSSTIFVSVVSLWEIAIKYALRRGGLGDMPISAVKAFETFQAAGYDILHVQPEHALAVADLPPARTDPFDRMLVAQARSEPLRLLTSDAAVAAYGGEIELV